MHLRFLYFLGEKSSLILIIDYIVMILEHNESLGILIFVKSCIMAFFCEKDPKSDEGFLMIFLHLETARWKLNRGYLTKQLAKKRDHCQFFFSLYKIGFFILFTISLFKKLWLVDGGRFQPQPQ